MPQLEASLTSIDTAADELFEFLLRLARTAGLLAFRPLRACSKLFRENGQLSADWVQPGTYAVAVSLLYYVFARLVIGNAFAEAFFSKDRLRSLYEVVQDATPNQLSIGSLLFSVGPMLVYLDLMARLVARAYGSDAARKATIHKLVLLACSHQVLLAMFGAVFCSASSILRLFTFQTDGNGIRFPVWSQLLFYGLNGALLLYVLAYPGVALFVGQGRRLTGASGMARRSAAIALACLVVGPGAMAVGGSTTALEHYFGTQEVVSVKIVREGMETEETSGGKLVAFNALVLIHNDTSAPLWLLNEDLSAEIKLDDGTTLPARLQFKDAAERERRGRIIGAHQANWFSIQVDKLASALSYAPGTRSSYRVTVNLRARNRPITEAFVGDQARYDTY
jgi:hypothetical protein